MIASNVERMRSRPFVKPSSTLVVGVKRAVRKKPNPIHRRVIIKQLDVIIIVDGESAFHHNELNSEAYPGRTNLESKHCYVTP